MHNHWSMEINGLKMHSVCTYTEIVDQLLCSWTWTLIGWLASLWWVWQHTGCAWWLLEDRLGQSTAHLDKVQNLEMSPKNDQQTDIKSKYKVPSFGKGSQTVACCCQSRAKSGVLLILYIHIFKVVESRFVIVIALGDRFWLFIQTLNNAQKSFNSIFNSKTRSNYSFKEFIHSKKSQIILSNKVAALLD